MSVLFQGIFVPLFNFSGQKNDIKVAQAAEKCQGNSAGRQAGCRSRLLNCGKIDSTARQRSLKLLGKILFYALFLQILLPARSFQRQMLLLYDIQCQREDNRRAGAIVRLYGNVFFDVTVFAGRVNGCLDLSGGPWF